MTDFLDLFAGNPRSPYHQPDAIEIGQALNELALSAGLSGRSFYRDTLAELNAVTGESAGDAGFVLADG
ncbi:hypothetical protein, partial [Roseivivax isoporae]|uniref:hypothetical protein n=1 Tax=Roseivivax isoporae TaxID=591206 RepID=UPI0005C20389